MKAKFRRIGFAAILIGSLAQGNLLSSATAQEAQPASGARVEVAPIIPAGSSNAPVAGMTEVYVRITNPSTRAISGTTYARVTDPRAPSEDPPVTTAPFQVAAQSTAVVKVPVYATAGIDIRVEAPGIVAPSIQLQATAESAVRIVDVHEPGRFVGLDGLPITSNYLPPYNPYGGPVSTPPPPKPPTSKGKKMPTPATTMPAPARANLALRVVRAVVDPSTGEPILPSRTPTWHGVSAVLMPTAKLVAMKGEELEALAGFVMGGGTLALSVTRPEDLRHSTVVALTGGEAQPGQASDANLPSFKSPILPSSVENVGNLPLTEVLPENLKFTSYSGGNLNPSAFGGSATYGLGQVVLLGFDVTSPQVAESVWVQVRIAELARQAFERKQATIVRLGEPPASHGAAGPFATKTEPYENIRRLLDPNRTARWGIGVAALLICLYAVLAGPVAFAFAKKRHKPLWALIALPILSFITFMSVVTIGVAAKGIGTTSRRLTVIDAGAGMPKGVSRRFRAFFSSTSQTISASASERTNSMTLAMGPEIVQSYVLDGDGFRITELEAMPAQTMLLREDGLTSIGDGVSITKDPSGSGIVVTNRTGMTLAPVVVKLDDDTFRLVEKMADGESLSSDKMSKGDAAFQRFSASVIAPSASAPPSGAFSYMFTSAMNDTDADFGRAWMEFEQSAVTSVDAFPVGVPVIVAGATPVRAKDSGVIVAEDRILLRVIGFGGEAP